LSSPVVRIVASEACWAEQIYAATQQARTEHPEAWAGSEGVVGIGKLWYNAYASTKESSGGASNTPLPDQVLDWRT
jgi:hypothetical protein